MIVVFDWQQNAAQVHAERTGMEAGVHEETRHGMRGNRLAVDGGDEHALVAAAAHPLLSARAEKMRKACGSLGALRLLSGKEDEDVGIVAAQPCDELAVAQNDFGVGGAGENARRRFRVFVGDRQVGPAQDGAVGVGGIGCSELHELRFLGGGLGAQLAQQIDGGRESELRGAEAGDKIAAADAAAFFESLEHVVDGAESAGNVFCGDRFAE